MQPARNVVYSGYGSQFCHKYKRPRFVMPTLTSREQITPSVTETHPEISRCRAHPLTPDSCNTSLPGAEARISDVATPSNPTESLIARSFELRIATLEKKNSELAELLSASLSRMDRLEVELLLQKQETVRVASKLVLLLEQKCENTGKDDQAANVEIPLDRVEEGGDHIETRSRCSKSLDIHGAEYVHRTDFSPSPGRGLVRDSLHEFFNLSRDRVSQAADKKSRVFWCPVPEPAPGDSVDHARTCNHAPFYRVEDVKKHFIMQHFDFGVWDDLNPSCRHVRSYGCDTITCPTEGCHMKFKFLEDMDAHVIDNTNICDTPYLLTFTAPPKVKTFRKKPRHLIQPGAELL